MKKKIIYLIAFAVLGFIMLQIPFTNIVGSSQKFSLFDFMAPTIGAFLTSIWGALAVVIVKTANVLVNGQHFDTATVIRLFPLALAAIYFGARRHRKIVALIPVICMALFIAHPQGRGAWFYSLYWLIPLACAFVPNSLTSKSLGATFTAHAIGSVAFLYAFNLPTESWIALIPVVFLERMLFTAGTVAGLIVLNSLASSLSAKFSWSFLKPLIQPDYTISKKLLSQL